MQEGSEQEHGDQDRRDTVVAFVGELRALREGLDVLPTWDAMVRRATTRRVRVSKSTLHKIAKSDALPSELAVRGYLAALQVTDTEIDRWVARRAALAGPPFGEVADPGTGPEVARTPRLRTWPGWRWWVAAGAMLVVTNVVTGYVVHRNSAPQPQQNAAPASTGDNPVHTICVDDAKIAATTTKTPEFLLEIVFSAKCRAFWAKITRADDRSLGNRIEATIYRRSDPDGDTRQDAVEPDVKSGFTTMIVRADPTDRVCAIGAVVTDGNRVAAVEPICI